jgi:hypothetical protein
VVVLVAFEIDLRCQRLVLWMRDDHGDMSRAGQRPEQRVPTRYDALEPIASSVVTLHAPPQVERTGTRRVLETEQVEYRPRALICQMSRVAFAIGRQSFAAVTVPLMDSGSPGSSAGHKVVRHGAPRRYSGPRVASAVDSHATSSARAPPGSSQRDWSSPSWTDVKVRSASG